MDRPGTEPGSSGDQITAPPSAGTNCNHNAAFPSADTSVQTGKPSAGTNRNHNAAFPSADTGGQTGKPSAGTSGQAGNPSTVPPLSTDPAARESRQGGQTAGHPTHKSTISQADLDRINQGHRYPIAFVVPLPAIGTDDDHDSEPPKKMGKLFPHEPSPYWSLNPDVVPEGSSLRSLRGQREKARKALARWEAKDGRKAVKKASDLRRYISMYNEFIARAD